MNRMGSGLTVALAGIAMVGAESAAAQDVLMLQTPERGFWIEAAHPEFKGSEMDVTIPTTVWFVGGRVPLTANLRAVADIPFSYARFDISGADGNTVLGNPYLGMEYLASPRLMVEAGVRAPLTTADDESFADAVASLANPLRLEAFGEDIVPVSGAVNYMHALNPAMSLRGRAGITSALWTGDDDEGETTTFVDYGAFGTYEAGVARLGAGFAGRWDAWADEGNFSDNSLHHLGLSADARFRQVRPGISVQIPLDKDYRDVLSTTVGLYLQVPLR